MLWASAIASTVMAKEDILVLEEIIVAALTRSESVQDVGIAVSAVTDTARGLAQIMSGRYQYFERNGRLVPNCTCHSDEAPFS